MASVAPRPLKVVLDNIVADHSAPLRSSWLPLVLGVGSKSDSLTAASLLTVLIAVMTAGAMQVGSYPTESSGQSIGCASGSITT